MAESLFVTRITPNHSAIVDWEILHPGGTMIECSKAIGMSDNHISIIRNSDIFKDYRTRRLRKHHQNISRSVIEKTEMLACTSLDVLEERINNERAKMDMETVRTSADMALKALGFGNGSGSGGANAAANLTVVVSASPAMLEDARNRMREKGESAKPPQLIEGETSSESQEPGERRNSAAARGASPAPV